MREKITNKHNLKNEDITNKVVRVKALILNSKNEVMLGYCDHIYQFPGGHLEDGEEIIDCLIREIKEETGIELIAEARQFMVLNQYHKDYPKLGENRLSVVHYFEVKSDEKINLNQVKYTDLEAAGKFELRYIPLDKVEEELLANAKIYPKAEGIAHEMIDAFDVYKENNN